MLLAGINLHPTQQAALEDGERRLTYGGLCDLVEAERQWLVANGVQRCALLADNGCGWAIADLALLEAEIVNIPLPGYFVNTQIRHVLHDAGIAFILTDRPEQLCQEYGCTHVGQSARSGLTLLHRPATHMPALPAGTLKITYTSGSTSEPKGVCLSSHALRRVSASLHAALRNLDLERHMCLLPLATLLENIAGIYVPLLLGIQSVLRPASTLGMSYGGLDAARLLNALRDVQPSSLVLVPELLRLAAAGKPQVHRGGWSQCAGCIDRRGHGAGFASVRGLRPERMRLGGVFEPPRCEPPRQRRTAAAARTRAGRSEWPVARGGRGHVRLPR
jgi:long-chain acyl-CoA synthetase